MTLLFEPITINSLTVPHRIITGPMEKGMANRDGTLNPRYVSYLEARAKGGAGLILLESTYVDPIGMGHLFQVGCHNDAVVDGLRRAVEAVRPYGTKLALELYLGGRETPSTMSQRQPVAPSAVQCAVLDPVPTPREMTHADIDRIIGYFRAAARRAREAGIDMVFVHGAHGYLVASFLSPFSNRRTDEFGGPLANRARFPLMVVDALRSELGPDYPIGYRMSADEFLPEGLHIEESSIFAGMLADASVDLVDVSSGFYETSYKVMQGSESPEGGFVDLALRVKASVGDRALVSVTQRLSRPGAAEKVLELGIDMVSMTRAFHVDAEYVNKRKSGMAVTPCIACHHCVDMLEANLVSDCSVNPESSREYILASAEPEPGPSTVVVVGGGPAGMEAAARFAERGSHVVLLERAARLGGQVVHASTVFGDLEHYLVHAQERLAAAGVEVHLETAATPASIALLDPDLVVIATGAREGERYFDLDEGASPTGVFGAFHLAGDPDVDLSSASVVIAGGDWSSCVLAVRLSRLGSRVVLVEPAGQIAVERPGWAHEQLVRLVDQAEGLHVMLESTVEAAGERWVAIQSHGLTHRVTDVDLVVVGGRRSENSLAQELSWAGTYPVVVIGDALRPRDVHAATLDALRASASPRTAARLALV